MHPDFEMLYSDNAKGMKKSVIRELLKLTNNPEIISFAGGLPSPTTFPAEKISEITDKVLRGEYARALQYGATEGDTELREELAKFIRERGHSFITYENILITSASQQALDLISKVFINPGDTIICGLPSYVGGLGAFKSYRANLIGIPMDDDGIMTSLLRKKMEELKSLGKLPKFIYVIPDFQNPSGVTFTLERRKELLSIAKEYGTIILEDSPYRELRYNGEEVPSILKLDNGEGYVLSMYTFSKIFIPGFRLGWIVGHKDLIQKLVIAKQSMDLCSPPFTQCIAREYLKEGLINKQIKSNIAVYRPKKDLMLECLEKEMPKNAGIRWTKPEGGLFLFVYLPEYMNADELFYKAIEKNVAYVIGSAFYCNGGGQNSFRLNFSYPSYDDIRNGIKNLASVLNEAIQSQGKEKAINS
jgi:2-aminoadipate transaminase